MESFAEAFDDLIARAISTVGHEAEALRIEDRSDNEFIASETIGDVMDKMIILHIRLWHLMDMLSNEPGRGKKYAEISEKIEHCCRVKRPRLVNALNAMLEAAIGQGRLDLVSNHPIKQYGGFR